MLYTFSVLTRYIQQQSTVPHIREGSNDVARMEDGDNSRMVSDIDSMKKNLSKSLLRAFVAGGTLIREISPIVPRVLYCCAVFLISSVRPTVPQRIVRFLPLENRTAP